MKINLVFTAFLWCSTLFAQTILTNNLTQEHKEVRGSKISLIPPPEFSVATNFLGFQHTATNSSIMILDVPGPYAEIAKSLTTENLLKQGVIVQEIEQITMNGLPSMLITGQQTAYDLDFKKFTLVFGTDKESIMINGIVPLADSSRTEWVKKSVLSTVYDAAKVLNPLDAVDFQVSTLDTDFVFAKSMSNMLIYNRDGKVPVETADKASLVVAKAISKVAIPDKKEYAINRIKILPVQISKIFETNPIEINGLEGFEIIAEGVNRKTGEKEQAYQVMLFKDSTYYILFGSSQADFEANLVVFKKIARTFKLKE